MGHDIVKNLACEATHFTFKFGKCWAKSGDGKKKNRSGVISGAIQTSECDDSRVEYSTCQWHPINNWNKVIHSDDAAQKSFLDSSALLIKSFPKFDFRDQATRPIRIMILQGFPAASWVDIA